MDNNKIIRLSQISTFIVLLILRLCSCKIGELYINSNLSEYYGLVGQDFNLTCEYDTNTVGGCENLFFADAEQKPLPGNTEHLNNSTILYKVRNPSMMSGNYYCKCKIGNALQILDLISVKIGTKPQKIKDEDFQCMSHQLKYFECSFKEPYNPVPTQYNLTFKLQSLNQIYTCKLLFDDQKYICNITQNDDQSRYIASANEYKFTLSSTNLFGFETQTISVKHNDLIVPSKPDLIIKNITQNNITFVWQKSVFSNYDLTCNLRCLIEYDNTNDNDKEENDKNFKTYPITACDVKSQQSEITLKLPFAYTWYDIRFSYKIRSAANESKWWSQSYTTTLQTKSRGPDRPPITDMGSFFIDQKNVHLFWVKLPVNEENGPNLTYIIDQIKENDVVIDLEPQKLDSQMAIFAKPPMGLKLNKWYEFHIKSKNNVSKSDDYGVITIPPITENYDRLKEEYTTELKKLISNNNYTLSWKPPKNIENLINYTIFWCKTKQESSTECDGSIELEHVEHVVGNEGEQNYTKARDMDALNFAISANYRDFSYGMSWAACTASLHADLPQMFIQIKDQKHDSFVIHWNLECVIKSVLKGYNLTYCEANNEYKCVGNETTISNIPITKKDEYKLQKLNPYTIYIVKMLMYSEKNKGLMSQPVAATTLEAAPSEPRNLKEEKVTSSYVDISWQPPVHLNGFLKSYTIHYGANSKKISNEELNEKYNKSEDTIKYRLGGLRNNHVYKVYVEAETVGTNKSNSIYVTTWMGKPDAIQKIIRDPKSLSSHSYTWKQPSQNDGNISFYVVRVTVNHHENIVSYVNTNSCTFNLNLIDSCNGVSNYRLAVSAVNAIPKDKYDSEAFQKVELKLNRYENKCNSILSRRRRVTSDHQKEIEKIQCLNPQSFQCLENIDAEKLKSDYSNSVFAQNELQDSDSFTCFHPKESNSKQALILGFGTVAAIGVMAGLMFSVVKKYKKMKDIDFKLPPGLADLNQDNNTQLENNNQDAQSDDSLGVDDLISSIPIGIGFVDPTVQHHHNKKYQSSECLLPSSHDSGFPPTNEFLSENSNNGYILHDNMFVAGFDVKSTDAINGNDESSSTQSSSASVEMSDMSNNDSRSPSISPKVNLLRTADNTPIQAGSKIVLNPRTNPVIVNGYVQQTVLQKPPPQPIMGQNGYTTLEALGKPNTMMPSATKSFNPSSNYIDTSNLQQRKPPQPQIGIGGYVTQKQLSEFGQHLQ